MYQYNSNGQKVPMGNMDVHVPKNDSKEHYGLKSGSGSGSGSGSISKTIWIWVCVGVLIALILIGLIVYLRKNTGSSTASMGMTGQRWGFKFY